MSTAETTIEQEVGTGPAPPEELVAESGTVTFTARVHNLIVTVFPALREPVGGGQKATNAGGFRIQFVNHLYKVDDRKRRDYKAFVAKYGHHHAIDDDDHQSLLETPLEDFLRQHPAFKSNQPDGFYEVVAPVPEPTEELRRILDAALDSDEDALAAIQERELATHKRPAVLDACKKALENVYLTRAGQSVTRGPQAPSEPPQG